VQQDRQRLHGKAAHVWRVWHAGGHAFGVGKPDKAYPVMWTAPNYIWQPMPPPAQCLKLGQLGPPPGSGGDGPVAEFQAGRTIAVELPAKAYTLPAKLAADFAASGLKAGDALKAALQADWIADFWAVTLAHKASNGAERDSALLYSSGGYVFEWRDEWWKGNEGHPYFHSISGNQQCGVAWEGCPTTCNNTGAANPVLSGGWGDEEWFGATGGRANGRKDSDPVIVPSTGKLNGGPDILVPRAAVAALCQLFSPNQQCP
jgi:hypothetical protein